MANDYYINEHEDQQRDDSDLYDYQQYVEMAEYLNDLRKEHSAEMNYNAS
jgi:hypothetical protein